MALVYKYAAPCTAKKILGPSRLRSKFDHLWDLLNDRRTERGMEPFDMFGGH